MTAQLPTNPQHSALSRCGDHHQPSPGPVSASHCREDCGPFQRKLGGWQSLGHRALQLVKTLGEGRHQPWRRQRRQVCGGHGQSIHRLLQRGHEFGHCGGVHPAVHRPQPVALDQGRSVGGGVGQIPGGGGGHRYRPLLLSHDRHQAHRGKQRACNQT